MPHWRRRKSGERRMLIEEARKRVERNPTDLQFRFELGEHLMNAGHFREALAGVAARPTESECTSEGDESRSGDVIASWECLIWRPGNWKKPRARSRRWTRQKRKSFTISGWFTSGWEPREVTCLHEANLRGGLRLQRRGNASGKFLRGRELIKHCDCNYDQLPRAVRIRFAGLLVRHP